jgi:signal transduction histidine kinase
MLLIVVILRIFSNDYIMVFGNTPFSGHAKVGIISTILIIVISCGLFFYQQGITEENVRNSLFVQQRDRQMEATKNMAGYITSDLHLVLSILQGLAGSSYLQEGELYGDRIQKLMLESFDQINNITKVDGLFITDSDDVITYNVVGEGQRSFVNIDISFRDYVQETKNNLRPVFSDGFEGIDGIYRIALTFPIINRENGRYIGMVGVEIPTIDFFARYGNVYDIESQYIAALDRNSVQLIHPVKSFIGTPFFGNHTQEVTGHNKILNNLIQTVMSGKPDSAIYEFMNGQRLITGYPILPQGNPEYFLFIITPTANIYTQVNDVLFTERLKMSSLFTGATAAIVVLMVFLIKWNSTLNNQVKRRTRELQESNQQLKNNDKLQKEFINTAAHELRTPIQPILGLSAFLSSQTKDREQRKLLDIITRNANRLQRLAEDILDVSRIESNNLPLKKEQLDINDLIQSIVQDYRSRIERENNKSSHIDISFEHKEDVILVDADKLRLGQVISNLLDNSVKFTESRRGGGRKFISIVSEKKDDLVIVNIKDTGTGIDPEIIPRLFSRFASKSFSGTGLGLFICKNIVESQGGTISGQNNPDGIGATFSFSIPLDKKF